MRVLFYLATLLSSTSVLASTCPDLTGTFRAAAWHEQERVQISQTADCSQVTFNVAQRNQDTLLHHQFGPLQTNGTVNGPFNGEYFKVTFDSNALRLEQVQSDGTPLSPVIVQTYALAADGGLDLTHYISGNPVARLHVFKIPNP